MNLPDWHLHSEKRVFYLNLLVINTPDGESVRTDGLI